MNKFKEEFKVIHKYPNITKEENEKKLDEIAHKLYIILSNHLTQEYK